MSTPAFQTVQLSETFYAALPVPPQRMKPKEAEAYNAACLKWVQRLVRMAKWE